MKKGKILVVGLIGLLMAVGMVLVSCAESCKDSVVGSACKVSWSDGIRDSGSMFCAQKKCNVVKNWNNAGSSSNCNCD